MVTTDNSRDERRAQMNADGEWASTYAWGFAVLTALAALFLWAVFGRRWPPIGRVHLTASRLQRERWRGDRTEVVLGHSDPLTLGPGRPL